MNFNHLNFQNQYNPYSYVPPFFQGFQSYPQDYNPFNYQLFYQNFNFLQEKKISFGQLLPTSITTPTRQNLQPQKQSRKQCKRLKNVKQISQITQSEERRLRSLHKNLIYFDPSEAPRVTSIRKKQQIQIQLLQSRSKEGQRSEQQSYEYAHDQDTKLRNHIKAVLSQPNEDDYPFIIYRNPTKKKQKRRYSALLFSKRAYYIRNKIKIPQDCQPKSRSKVKGQQQLSSQNDDNQGNFRRNLENIEKLEDNVQQQDFVQKQENPSQYYGPKELSMRKSKFFQFQKSNESSIDIKLQES